MGLFALWLVFIYFGVLGFMLKIRDTILLEIGRAIFG
jgi:hypothetical protein